MKSKDLTDNERRAAVQAAYAALSLQDQETVTNAARALVNRVKGRSPNVQMSLDMALEVFAMTGVFMVERGIVL